MNYRGQLVSRQTLGAFNKGAALKQQFDAKDRHEAWKPLSDVALVSPEADWLAFQVGRQFRLWQAERGHWLRLAQKYDGKFVSALASSPDGKTLAVAVRRDKLDLIDLATGDVSTTWSLRHRVPFAMEFSADGKRLAVALAGHVAVHDSATGEELARFDQPALPLTKVAISGDGRYVAAASLGERVWTWDTEQQSQMLLLDIGGQIRDLEFSRAGRLAVLSRSGQISLWAVGEATNIESTSDSERLTHSNCDAKSRCRSGQTVASMCDLVTTNERKRNDIGGCDDLSRADSHRSFQFWSRQAVRITLVTC